MQFDEDVRVYEQWTIQIEEDITFYEQWTI